MFCSNCGNQIQEGENFCGKCGKKVNEKETKSSVNNNRKTIEIKLNILVIFACVLIATFLIMLLVVYNETNNQNSEVSNGINNINSEISSEYSNNTINKELSLNDVQINQEFINSNNMNEATMKVASCAMEYIKLSAPNAMWSKINISQKDDYGRFWVVVNYVKSSSSENVSFAGVMVWIKDINNNNMGYYYTGSPLAKSNGWGTPLPDDM